MSSDGTTADKLPNFALPQDLEQVGSGTKLRAPRDLMSNVYFIQCNGSDGPIKIGYARRVRARLSAIQTGSPHPMTLLASFPANDGPTVERGLHYRFAALHISGEWFRSDPSLLRFIHEQAERAAHAPFYWRGRRRQP